MSTSAFDQGPNIRWDDSLIRIAYANLSNGSGTREEIVLLLVVNQSWMKTSKERVFQWIERIISNPFAAEQLNVLLSRVPMAYAAKYSQLPMEAIDQSLLSETLSSG